MNKKNVFVGKGMSIPYNNSPLVGFDSSIPSIPLFRGEGVCYWRDKSRLYKKGEGCVNQTF